MWEMRRISKPYRLLRINNVETKIKSLLLTAILNKLKGGEIIIILDQDEYYHTLKVIKCTLHPH